MDLLLGCSDVTEICEENDGRRPGNNTDCQQSELPLLYSRFFPLCGTLFSPLFLSLRHQLFTQTECKEWI